MIKLTQLINELGINKPVSFWNMVAGVIVLNTYYAEGLLNSYYDNWEDYMNDYSISDEEEYKQYFDYFSKIQPNEIKSKINFKIFDKDSREINEGISYNFIEMWYMGNGYFGLALHNNNKIFLKDE